MPLFQSPPSSICILRLSAIGDCCHVAALIGTIQREWPDTRITWIIGKLEATLFADMPGVEIIAFDKNLGWKSYLQLWRQLRGRQFNALLHLQTAIRASIASVAIRATWRLGFDKARTSDGQRLFINHRVPSPPSPHVLDGFLAFARELGIHNLTPVWQLPVQLEYQRWANKKIDGKPTLLICAAASKPFKNWTVEGYAALADHAVSRGFQVYLCGGPTPFEHALATQIQQLSHSKPTSLVGQTSLAQLLALIAQATIILAPDTGPAHMATVVGTPVIGLYAHHNPARTGPYLSRDHIVSVYQPLIEQQSGKKLAELNWRTRLNDPKAMEHITISTVIAAFERLCIQLFPHDK